MVDPDRLQVVGPFPGSESSGELLGVMVEDHPKELLPVHLIPVRESVSTEAEVMEQARRAAAAAANLKHPNILRTFGIEEIQGKTMQVKAWIETFPLRAIVQEGGRLPPQFAARILVDVCRATQHALDRGGEGGRVAGALSLDTVLVAASGVTQVVGFGVPARSPPAIEADIHALGTLLHALLSGDLPPEDQTGEGATVPTQPPPLSQLGITGPLAEIATRALSEEALAYFRSPSALAEAIGRVSGDLVQPAAVATYLDLVFPPEEGDRAARRTAIATALAKHQLATDGKAKPERKPLQERPVEPEQKVATPAPTVAPVEAQIPEVQPPPIDRPAGKQPSAVVDLVSTTDIVLDSTHLPEADKAVVPLVPAVVPVEAKPPEVQSPPADRPAGNQSAAVVDLVSTAEIVLESSPSTAAPDLVSTADIVAEPPQMPPKPDLVSTADIVPELVRPLPPWPSLGTGLDQSQATPPVAQPRFLPEIPAGVPVQRRPEVLWAGVIAFCLVLGFCFSYFLGFGVPALASTIESGSTKATEVTTVRPQVASPSVAVDPPSPMVPRPSSFVPLPSQARPAPAPAPKPVPETRPPPGKPKLNVSAEPAGDIFIDGKLAGRSPFSKTVNRGSHKVRLHDAEQGIDVTQTVEVKGPETRVRFTVGTGRLTVIAPEGAAIFVDNRRVGTTEIRDLSIWEGEHRLLVTLGQARDTHVFQLQAGGNYLYEVAKTAEQ